MNRRITRLFARQINVKQLQQKIGKSLSCLSFLSAMAAGVYSMSLAPTRCLFDCQARGAVTESSNLISAQREQGTGNREQGIGNRESKGTGNREQGIGNQREQEITFPRSQQFSITVPRSLFPIPSEATVANKQKRSRFISQGQKIYLNDRQLPVAWSQWYRGRELRTGLADIGVMEYLGLELLNTDNPKIQPVKWFSSDSSKPTILETNFVSSYRYLDITDFAKLAGWEVRVRGNNLIINSPKAQIQNVRRINRPQGQQIIIELDRPTFWQAAQVKTEGAISMSATAKSSLIKRFPAPSPVLEDRDTSRITSSPIPDDRSRRDPLSGARTTSPEARSPLFFLENSETQTVLRLNIPTGNGLQVSSSSNPHRLIVDINSNPSKLKQNILWAPGLRWRKELVSLDTRGVNIPTGQKKEFPVVWLEVDQRATNIKLAPITVNPFNLQGTAPLVTTARLQGAVAAINGGFFNRNNQLPLGAIKRSGRWLSGPILNRGAIAWDNRGRIEIARLSLHETLITARNKRIPIFFFNTGYVQKGMARYTKEWGENYTPMTDNETIFLVINNRVVRQLDGGIAGKITIPIPKNGYLLTQRGDRGSSIYLSVGDRVVLESVTSPSVFANYPNIVGAGPVLLQNRRIVLNAPGEKFSNAFSRQAAIRSAIANSDRGVILIASVGKSVSGSGATLGELAQIMQRLGAVDALNLDGGSSTSLYLGGQLIDRPARSVARVHNGIGIFIDKSN